MSDAEKTIFISYRRSASKHLARAVFMDLRANGYDAFFDVNTIDSGAFDTIILNQIAARAHFVVLLSPGALDRCNEPGDWLRREIELAIDLQRNIVPILEEGFTFKDAEPYMTGKLSALPRFNAVRLFHDYFDEAMDKLRNRFLKQPVYGAITPTPTSDAAAVQRSIEQAAVVPTQPAASAEEYYRRGDEKYIAGDYEGAIKDCTQALALKPDYPEAYKRRGAAYYRLRRYAQAIADYTEALRIDPQYIAAYNNRAAAYKSTSEYDRALSDYNAAIRLAPHDADLYYNRGNTYAEIDEIDRALADYQKYLELGGGERNGDQQAMERWINDLKTMKNRKKKL